MRYPTDVTLTPGEALRAFVRWLEIAKPDLSTKDITDSGSLWQMLHRQDPLPTDSAQPSAVRDGITLKPNEARMVFARWLRMRSSGLRFRVSPMDIEHSALLGRLLHGMEPLAVPPPLKSAYPWYALFDDGIAHNVDLTFEEDGQLVIDQNGGQWSVVTTVSDDDYIVTCGGNTRFRATRNPESAPVADPTSVGWTLELISGPSADPSSTPTSMRRSRN
jgi:hypothetical protein